MAAKTLVGPVTVAVEHDSMNMPEVLEQAFPVNAGFGMAPDPKRTYRSALSFV